MSNPSVDEALAHALADAPAAPPAETPHTVVESTQGPATREEAQALVERARKSATTFVETMKEILDRQAWRPLGYDNPRSFVRAEFKDITAYTGSYVRRMSNVAWMLWAIAEGTNVDVISVDVPDKLLKQIPGGQYGENHEKLVETIVGRVQEAGGDDEDVPSQQVQDIITGTMEETIESGEVPPAPAPEEPQPVPQQEGAVQGREGTHVDQSTRYGRDEVDEEQDWQEAAPPPPAGGAAPPPPLPGGSAGAPEARPAGNPGASPEGAASAFRQASPEAPGSHAPANQPSFAEVLDSTRAAEKKVAQVKEVQNYSAAMNELSGQILAHAPEVRSALSKALGPLETLVQLAREKGDLEGIFDGFDDDELRESERQVTTALNQLGEGKLVAVVLAAAAEAEGIPAGGGDRLVKAASEMESLVEVRTKFEDMLEELRFLM